MDAGTDYRLVVDVPGASKDDVKVEAGPLPGTLLVRVTGKDAPPQGQPLRIERPVVSSGTRFERVVPVGPDADATKAKTSLKDGVLTITVPKRESAPATGKS